MGPLRSPPCRPRGWCLVSAVTGAGDRGVEAPRVEWEMATDMVRRGVPVAPLPVLIAAAFHGVDGALSAGYGVVLVLLNLLASAGLMAWAAGRSLGVIAGVASAGYAVRLGLLTFAVWLVKDMAWVELVPLGLTILVAQLGLLWWETRHLSLSLAYPGLKPPPGRS